MYNFVCHTRQDQPRSSDTRMSVWKYVCAQRLGKQMNVTVSLAVWYRRWRDKESAETRADVYRRRSWKSFIK